MSSTKQIMQSQPEKAGSNSGWICLYTVLTMIFTMGLLKIYSPDLGFHLKSAKWIIDNKQFIYSDSFTYTSAGNNYYDLQWFYQLLIYALYTLGNAKLLIIGNALLITASFILIWIRVLKNNKTEITRSCILFSLIAILAAQPLTFEIRPHVLSWIFLNLTLLTLELYKREKRNILFLLPLITIIWVNTHSLAILGLVTIGIYLVGSYFETGSIDKKLLRFLGFSFAAFLVNPYFINGLLYPLSQFVSISGNNLQKLYISEMQSPFSSAEIRMLGIKYLLNPLFLLHIYSVISLLAIVNAIRTRQYINFLLMVAYFLIFFLALKNYGFFVMVSLPVVVKYLLSFRLKKITGPLQINGGRNLSGRYMRLSIATLLIATIIIITSITDGYPLFRQSPYRFGFAVDNDQLPVEATAFLKQNKIQGKFLNHLDFGGYLMANYSEKVFIDGRMELPEERFFAEYFESLTTKNGISALLKKYDPDVVVFPYIKASLWWQYFITHRINSGYKPVYFDGLAVIYVKSVKYPGLPEVSELKIVSGNEASGTKELEELIKEKNKPTGTLILMKGLLSKQYFSIADQNKATYCFTYGFNNAALNYSLEGIKKSTVHTPDIYKNLSIYFTDVGNYADAEICNDKAK